MTVIPLPKKPREPEPIDLLRELVDELRLALEAGRLTPALGVVSRLGRAIENCFAYSTAKAYELGRERERREIAKEK